MKKNISRNYLEIFSLKDLADVKKPSEEFFIEIVMFFFMCSDVYSVCFYASYYNFYLVWVYSISFYYTVYELL